MIKPRLFSPGPSSVPEKVNLAMAQPIIHHRSAEFQEISERVNSSLQKLFCTSQPVLTLTSSGTGAIEATMQNLFSVGDKGIFVNNGKFAERLGSMMRGFGMETIEITVDWGTSVRHEQLIEALRKHPDLKCVWLVHSETSTGVFTDIELCAKIIHENSEALVCVDGISSVGVHTLLFDSWQIDVAITSSQKGLMMPPGLAFVCLSEQAWKFSKKSTLPKYYFDLAKAKTAWLKNSTPWTPAINLVVGLDISLNQILNEGLENVWNRHELLSKSVRAGIKAVDLKLFGFPASHAVTAIELPDNGTEFLSILKNKHKITVASGQDKLKNIIFRIGHLGYSDEGDALTILSAIEQSLKAVGHNFTAGAGVMAVQQTILQTIQQNK